MMRNIYLLLIALLTVAGHASAQTANAYAVTNCGTPPQTYTAPYAYGLTQTTGGVLCVIFPSGGGGTVFSIPPKVTAQGTLAVSSSSVALSTLTVATNSAAWLTTLPSNYVTIRNSINSTAILYVCLFGGTCTTSGTNVGEPIAIGETIVRQLTSPANPTLICGTASACTAVAEE